MQGGARIELGVSSEPPLTENITIHTQLKLFFCIYIIDVEPPLISS